MDDFVTLACPTCGSKLKIFNNDVDHYVCENCGNEHIVRRRGGIVSLDPVIQRLDRIESALARADRSVGIESETNRIAILSQSKDRWTAPLIAITAVLIAVATYFTFGYAPTADVLSGGDVQRIFYFHVGIAWIAGLALFVTFVCSILYLWRGENRKYDIIAAASVEIGVVFGVMVLLSGMLWARPVWNTWWTWDPRLTTTAITEFLYVAYLMLRGAVDDPQRRARFSAVYGVIAFASVPITYFSTKWFNTIHPDLFDGKSLSPLTAGMKPAMFISLAAFTLIYIVLLRMRAKVETATDEVAMLKQDLVNN